MNLAPIVLFVYNRPWHTEQTLLSLSSNKWASESELIIYADGPKHNATPDQLNNIKKVRELLYRQKWPRKLTVHVSDTNAGLATAVIKGVTQTLQQYNRIIVLEDDMILSPYFLQFMNDGLEKYEQVDEVISIHGYCLPIKHAEETFFLRGADCWGWATWQRGWKLFNPDSAQLIEELKQQKSVNEFDFNGTYDFSGLLKKQANGKINSWAIRWYASAFILNKLTLYPGKSLVKNIGGEGSGTHPQDDKPYQVKLNHHRVELKDIPIVESKYARELIEKHFLKHIGLKRKLKRIFKRRN